MSIVTKASSGEGGGEGDGEGGWGGMVNIMGIEFWVFYECLSIIQ
jgi:hypothetical protein